MIDKKKLAEIEAQIEDIRRRLHAEYSVEEVTEASAIAEAEVLARYGDVRMYALA